MPGFWSRVTGFARKNANPDWGTLERYLGWAFGGAAAATGIIVNPQTAMQAAAVYACVKVLAESVGQLPLYVYRKGAGMAKDIAEDHPLHALLSYAPNEWQTTTEFFEMVMVHLALRGNAYAYINRTRSGNVLEMLPIHPDMVTVLQDSGWNLIYQIQDAAGGMRTVKRTEILHIRGLTLNGYLGISPIAYARESIGLALATEKFGGQLFRNGAKMGGVLEHPGKLSGPAYERIKTSFDEAYSGENAHKTAVLEEGMKFSKVSMTADDSQFLETRKYQRSEIASIFRVPPHLIGDLERATFSNIEQQSKDFVQNALMPYLSRIERAIVRDVVKKEERGLILPRFDVSELLRGDAVSRAEYYNSGILAGWLTRNEARFMEDLNPLDGLEVPLMPLNMTDGREAPEEPEDKPDGDEGNPQNVLNEGEVGK